MSKSDYRAIKRRVAYPLMAAQLFFGYLLLGVVPGLSGVSQVAVAGVCIVFFILSGKYIIRKVRATMTDGHA